MTWNAIRRAGESIPFRPPDRMVMPSSPTRVNRSTFRAIHSKSYRTIPLDSSQCHPRWGNETMAASRLLGV